MKKIFILPLALMFITSCEYISFKVPTKVAVPKLDSIDYTKIDDYPVFPECDSIPSTEKQRICFKMEMSKYIHTTLREIKINSKSVLNDTIIVKIIVDKNGKTRLSSIQKTSKINQNLPQLDSIIKLGLMQLPILQPAIKRGIPVSAEFSLPIVIKTD